MNRLQYANTLIFVSASAEWPIHNDPQNQLALVAWMSQEGSPAKWNPFSCVAKLPGSTPLTGNPDGVQNYVSLEQGLEAFASTLTDASADEFGYPAILAAMKIGQCACAVVESVALSSWGTWLHDPNAAIAFMTDVQDHWTQFSTELIPE